MHAWVSESMSAAIREGAGADWTPEHARAWGDALGATAATGA
jgi:hypothetical protein